MDNNENSADKVKSQQPKPPLGTKKIVDGNGATVCLLHKDKLYDKNYVEFAECGRVKTADEAIKSETYVRFGNRIFKSGEQIGTIKRDWFWLATSLLLILLIISVTALVVLTHEKKEPLTEQITVVDTSGEWGAEGNLAIFGSGKIKPGDKGKYAFMVTNPHAVRLNCKIEFTPSYENAFALPPIGYRLVSEGRTLGITKTESGFEAENVVIGENGSRAFYLEWEWIFDGGADENDTQAGIAGGKYSLEIKITAQETN